MRQIFDEVRKISKFGWFDMFLGSTLGIGTKIILSKIDGFLKGWILNITPLKKWVINIQTMAYNGARMVVYVIPILKFRNSGMPNEPLPGYPSCK